MLRRGWLDGLIGMAIFSGSLPTIRVAVLQLDQEPFAAFRRFAAGRR